MVVFGEPGHRRTLSLQAALRRRGLHRATPIDYAARCFESIAPTPRPSATVDIPTIVKLDAPAASSGFYDRLVRRGHARLERDEPVPADSDSCELAHRDMWFAGFADLVREIARDRETAGPTRWLNPPDDVLRMCDKWRCQQALAVAGVDIPPLLGLIESHAHLQQLLDAHDCDRVFVKARYGSAAAGVVAYRRHRDGREIAFTTTETVDDGGRTRLFNRLAPQRYRERNRIAALIDALAAQGCYAEAWVPKPRAAGSLPDHHFDLRVIAFGGEPRQRVTRIAGTPMTNLHLGNRRADPATLLDGIAMARVEATVRKAARAFPDSASIGFDLIPARDRCVVLEANAFGDFVRQARWQGADAYDDQAGWVADMLGTPADTVPRQARA
jgi:glutathione synthase/RimK-type ligase-like ATP-grasp enzyme